MWACLRAAVEKHSAWLRLLQDSQRAALGRVLGMAAPVPSKIWSCATLTDGIDAVAVEATSADLDAEELELMARIQELLTSAW